jgi:hypothetical protein
MSNNRRQQVLSFLDSITQEELDNYINTRKIDNINKQFLEKINIIKSNQKKNHFEKLRDSAGDEFGRIINNY